MRLTLYTDYALRVLIYIGVREGELSTIREISSAYQISRNHLMKVTHALQKLGYLDTVRGRSGGLRLALSAESILLGELVRKMEPDMALAECFGVDNQCVITRECKLKEALFNARQSFIDTLNEYTLAELITPGRRAKALRASLQIVNI